MIAQLAPLGATHHIQLVVSFSGEAVTVTALLRPKRANASDEDDTGEITGLRTVQIEGPVTDIERELPAHLTAAVEKIVAHTATLATLDAQLAAELAEKQAELAKAKTAAVTKSSVKAAATIAAKKAKPATAPADDDAEPPAATVAAPTIAGLQPAWKSLKAPAREAPKNPAPPGVPTDLADLFAE